MSGNGSGRSAGPSPVVSKRDTVAGSNEAEQAVVNEALRQLLALNAYPSSSSSPFTADARAPAPSAESSAGLDASVSSSHSPSHADVSYKLDDDDEELLLQELVNITAGTTPFVPSGAPLASSPSNHGAGSGVARAGVSAATSTQAQEQTSKFDSAWETDASETTQKGAGNNAASPAAPHIAAPSTKATSSGSAVAAPALPVKKKTRALTSKEEQDILDAILAAVDGQQSSVSGDLTGGSGEPAAAQDKQPQQQPEEEEEEQDAVERVLEEAKLLASSTVLSEAQRGELVLHIHEHVALRRQLADLSKTIGAPTCVALAEAVAPLRANTTPADPASITKSRSLAVAIGTTLGAVALFDQRWSLLGLCGSVEANVINARGAVVSLSLSMLSSAKEANEEPTAATGHAKGVFILWSLHSLSPLRVIKGECTMPLLRVQHLYRDLARVLVLEANGAVKLFQFWKVMSKHMLRSTTIISASAAMPISDVDTLPLPSVFYLRELLWIKENLPVASRAASADGGVPWLCAPPPLPSATAASAGVSRTAWSTAADKHLVAAVSNDAVLLYVVEAGLQGVVAGVARHTHPPSSVLSNEQVRFIALEQDGVAPRVLLCVSWNTEIEILLLNLQVPGTVSSPTSDAGAGGSAAGPRVEGVERIALLRLTAPLLQMVPLAGCSMLLLDQNNDAQLMDASVAVMVERHHFAALEYVTFTSRLCGVKYNGTLASNQTTALLLGKEHVYGISVYSWRERLSTLVARRKFVEALDLAKSFADDVALSMVGLSSNAAQRRRELHQCMERILLAYLESSLDSCHTSSSIPCPPSAAASPTTTATSGGGDVAGTESPLAVLQHVTIYCSTVDALDLLYGPVTRTLQQRGLLSHLLYVLERTMRHGVITYMPEPLIERFIDLFVHEDELIAVEVALGVANRASSPTKQGATPPAASAAASADSAPSGRERAELALMCLDTGLPNLLRLAQEHGLLRLSVTIMSYRQAQYVEALVYALDMEEQEDQSLTEDGQRCTTEFASVAVDLLEYTLKDCALLPGADIPASEQRPAKKAMLEFLLQTNAQGQHNLLRFLRRQPQHAIRVLLFALSDEGLCSPWSSSVDGFCRTQFVSSVYFILTGGTRTQPRPSKGRADETFLGRQSSSSKATNLFLITDEELSLRPDLRKLGAAELAQRRFPPYEAVHTFLSDAALFDEFFMGDRNEGDPGEIEGEEVKEESSSLGIHKQYKEGSLSPVSAAVNFNVWVDLVVQDALFAFQGAETAEARRELQEQLIRVLTPPFIPAERVAIYQPDFTRLRMARCLAALLSKEQRYTEAIRCYLDPVQNRVDPSLQRDVFAMLRGEMQRLQDLKTHIAHASALRQMSTSHRFDSDVFGDDESGDGDTGAVPPSPSPEGPVDASGPLHDSEVSRHTSNSSFAPPNASSAFPSTAATAAKATVEAAIKALQRGVMSQVEALVRIDATALAQFIFDYLPSNHKEVMRLLRGSNAAFLNYLDELMAQGDPTVENDINLQNTYIELLCAHAPERVFAHLQEKGSAITYDVQLALRAVRKYRIADASIYLLEKTMMIEEAMTVMLRATSTALADVREEVMARAIAAEANEGNHAHSKTASDVAARREEQKTSFASTPTADAAAAGSPFLTGATAVQAAPELLRLLSIGKSLCQKYQVDQLSSNSGGSATGSPEYWFRLLDVFMVPRRLLCEVVTQDEQLRASGGAGRSGSDDDTAGGDDDGGGTGLPSELEIAARCAAAAAAARRSNGPRATAGRYSPSPVPDGAEYRMPSLTRPLRLRQRVVMAALVAIYTQCTSDVLRAMMSSLDLAVVMDKVVQDNKDETFRPFKPIILDMMASLSFDLEASRLCEAATESDVMSLGRQLYRQLNTGIVTLSDCCALCHLHLGEPPPPATVEATLAFAAPSGTASPASPSAVCVYTCGHAYHTLCCVHVTASSPQSQEQQSGCYVCARQRFSAGQPVGECGAGARHGDATGGMGSAAPTAATRSTTTTIDVARMQRRIRQTKAKIDHTEDLYPLLKSYLIWGDAAPTTTTTTPANNAALRAAAGSNWVLAPSPRVPAAIGEVTASGHDAAATNLDEKDLGVETLTDAEILELFGSP